MNQPPIPKSILGYPLKVYGHKARLLDHILALVPADTRTFCDLFSCTGVVGWTLKRELGARIISNDIRRYAYLQLRSLVANNTTILTDSHLDLLLRPNAESEHYFLRCYSTIYGKRNADFLDTWAANIPQLDNALLRDIAAYVPIAAISLRLKYASQNYSVSGTLTGDQSFVDVDIESDTLTFARQRMPSLLHDNGAVNEVYNEDAVTLISRIDADVAYLDSPYCARGGSYCEETKHVEAASRIMTGHGATIENAFTSRLPYPPYTNFVARSAALMGFGMLLKRARHIARLIISYNTTSQIAPAEIVRIARSAGWDANEETTVDYFRPTTTKGADNKTQEVLIVCKRK
jgi:adenine-specific DNA methylase